MAAANIPYLDWLKLLLGLGPNLAAIWPHLQKIGSDELDALAESQAIAAILQGPQPAANLVTMTMAKIDGQAVQAEVLDAERQVLSLALPNRNKTLSAAPVLDFLRAALSYMMAHPEVWQFLLSLLSGLKPVPTPLPIPPSAV